MTTATTTEERAAGIRTRREALGLSRVALAAQAKLSLSHLQNIEQGLIPVGGSATGRVLAVLDRIENYDEPVARS